MCPLRQKQLYPLPNTGSEDVPMTGSRSLTPKPLDTHSQRMGVELRHEQLACDSLVQTSPRPTSEKCIVPAHTQYHPNPQFHNHGNKMHSNWEQSHNSHSAFVQHATRDRLLVKLGIVATNCDPRLLKMFCSENTTRPEMPPAAKATGRGEGVVAHMFDLRKLWATCGDFGVQVTAGTAALLMWTKMHGTDLERVDPHFPLAARADTAALILERATNNNEEVGVRGGCSSRRAPPLDVAWV